VCVKIVPGTSHSPHARLTDSVKKLVICNTLFLQNPPTPYNLSTVSVKKLLRLKYIRHTHSITAILPVNSTHTHTHTYTHTYITLVCIDHHGTVTRHCFAGYERCGCPIPRIYPSPLNSTPTDPGTHTALQSFQQQQAPHTYK